MAEFPAMPLFTDAYLGDTTHLTTIEHGAYLLLLMVAWRRADGCLPDDDRLLARYTKTTRSQWLRMRPTIEPFFTLENGSLVQRRLRDERNHVRQVRESQSANGRASALKRKGRHSTERQPLVNGASTPSPSPSPTKEGEAKASPKKARPEKTPLPVLHMIQETWNDMARSCDLSPIVKLTDARIASLRARCAEHGENEIMSAIKTIPASPFLLGEGAKGWKANFDWLLQPESCAKLLEGTYHNEGRGKGSAWTQ